MTQNSEQISEIQIVYKRPVLTRTITTSQEAYNAFRQIASWNPNELDYIESFYALYLNRANQVLASRKISQGGFSQTVVDPKTVFIPALQVPASAIILAHNHPSGKLKPSQADLSLTRKLVDGAKLLDFQILDHLIITSESYLSMADDGLL